MKKPWIFEDEDEELSMVGLASNSRLLVKELKKQKKKKGDK